MSQPAARALRRGFLSILLLLAAAVQADPPVVGSRGAVIADPPLAVPAVEPCVVRLYQDEVFDDFSLHDFSYAPPAACPGRSRKSCCARISRSPPGASSTAPRISGWAG